MSALLVILAGGEGRRMGGDKPLARLGGATLIDHALRWAAGQGLPVAVSVRDAGQVAGTRASRLIHDRPGVEGPLAGVLGALDHGLQAGLDAVVTVAVDMPFLPTDLAARLLDAAGDGAAVAASGGRWHPACACWPVAGMARIARPGARDFGSLRGALGLLGAVPVDWPCAQPDPFGNINDPADLAAAQRWFQKQI